MESSHPFIDIILLQVRYIIVSHQTARIHRVRLRRFSGEDYDFLCRWVSTAITMIAPVSISRLASGTALMLRIFSR